jgi:hypothetical protein
MDEGDATGEAYGQGGGRGPLGEMYEQRGAIGEVYG